MPPYTPYVDPDTGISRMFIPSKTKDNQILLLNDPEYRNRIKAATGGNESLRKAWLEGDWNIIAGAFFDCWSTARHVIRPFQVPDHWAKFISGDWGSAKPFSFGWWAVVTDDYRTEEGLTLPRGCLVRYREWYGMARGANNQPLFNTGLKLTAEDVGLELATRQQNDKNLTVGVIDPAAFANHGGPSIAERLILASKNKVQVRRADNTRIPQRGSMSGWDQMRARLMGEDEDRPMIVCFSTCHDSIRTIPLMQHDESNIEDVNTDGEDHAADDWRYACMSRPWIKPNEIAQAPRFPTDLTINEIIKRHGRRNQDN
jgi:hypothetical protein